MIQRSSRSNRFPYLAMPLLSVAAFILIAGAQSATSQPSAENGGPSPSDRLLPQSGTIYETNYRSNTIEVFSRRGANLGTFAMPSHPTGLVFDNSGNLYVSSDDPAAYAILKYTPTGLVSVFADSGLNAPHALVFDQAGNLYVANVQAQTIEKFTPDGVGTVFADAEDGLAGPVDLAFDAQGNLYVTNAHGGPTQTGSVERFTPEGVGSVFADSGFNLAYGLALDQGGNVYVSNYLSNTIEKFSPDGVDLGVFASDGVSSPHGMIFDRAGNLYVANNGNNTIEKFSPTGADLGVFARTGLGPHFLAMFRPGRRQFQDVTTQSGLSSAATRSWGNPIWADINNDGFVDLIVPTDSPQPFVYLNSAGGTFTDIRASCGIAPSDLDSGVWRGFASGDYDGDGNLDLYIAELADGSMLKRDLLFKGHGDGTFENVTQAAGIETSTQFGFCSYWIDYDNDGKLDLFVKNYGGPSRLYKNNGDGAFTQVADAAGLADATLGAYHGTICSFADYDNDGFMDVAFSGERNALYRNNGGTFGDVTAAAGMTTSRNSTGIAWGDYNNDGLLDLYIARGTTGSGSLGNTLYRNNGDGTFTDVTAEAGLVTTANTWAAVWGDYDNDGFLDLFVTCAGASALGTGNANLLYHNNGDGTFTNVAATEGVTLEDGVSLHKGAAWVDHNNDGFLDLILKDGIGNEGAGAMGLFRLFKNVGNSNHFIRVNLVGVQSNRNGIGARVTVTSAAGMSFRQNNGGGGGDYASQGSEPMHFGISQAATASVQVEWPSGIVDLLASVPADSTINVVEGSTGLNPNTHSRTR